MFSLAHSHSLIRSNPFYQFHELKWIAPTFLPSFEIENGWLTQIIDPLYGTSHEILSDYDPIFPPYITSIEPIYF